MLLSIFLFYICRFVIISTLHICFYSLYMSSLCMSPSMYVSIPCMSPLYINPIFSFYISLLSIYIFTLFVSSPHVSLFYFCSFSVYVLFIYVSTLCMCLPRISFIFFFYICFLSINDSFL